MKTIETVKTFNGNNQEMIHDLPLLVIHGKMNDIALGHMRKNTGIDFMQNHSTIEGQPDTANQLARVFLTYNFKTQYHDNATFHNTLFMRFCNNEGFQVKQICPTCVKENHIMGNWKPKPEDRLSV